jgi:hypothetical protein
MLSAKRTLSMDNIVSEYTISRSNNFIYIKYIYIYILSTNTLFVFYIYLYMIRYLVYHKNKDCYALI